VIIQEGHIARILCTTSDGMYYIYEPNPFENLD